MVRGSQEYVPQSYPRCIAAVPSVRFSDPWVRRLNENREDRRSSNRMPIVREVRYKVLSGKQMVKRVGSGKTLNMSSRAMLFTTESTLAEGELVEVAVSWPA